MQQLRVTRELDCSGAAVIGVGGIQNLLGGKTYFYHSGGSDGYEGTNPNYPLATLDVAWEKLRAGKNDYIFLQGSEVLSTESPLILDTKDTHIIGLGSGNFDNGISVAGDATGAVFRIASYDMELAGMNIGANSASYNCIDTESGTTCYRNHIHHCTFGHNYLGLSGIHVWELSHCKIDNCMFGDMLAGYGITAGSFVDNVVDDCLFYRLEEKGIFPTTGCLQLFVNNCRFYSPVADAETIGWGITLPAAATHCLITNCVAGSTSDCDGEDKAFYDLSSADAATSTNGWANNIQGAALIDAGDTGE